MHRLKQAIRCMLRRSGFELLHHTADPILTELRLLHEKLRLDPQNHVEWSDSLAQPASQSCLRNLLQLHRIDLVLDVGANRGQFAQLIRRLGYTGEIISFEPLARYRSKILALAAGDPPWRLVPVAVGNSPAELDLHVYQDDSFSSLHTVNEAARGRFGGLVTESCVEHVSVRRLDDMWPELSGLKPRRVLLKTDTQGHDLAVIEGATEVLHSTHAIITEAAFVPLYDGAPLFFEMAAVLAQYGFVVSDLFSISHRPDDLALIEMDCAFTRPKSMPLKVV